MNRKKIFFSGLAFSVFIFICGNSSAFSHPSNRNHLYSSFYFPTPKDTTSAAADTADNDIKYREFIFQNEYGTNSVVKGRINGKLPYSEPGFTYNALSGFNCGFTITRLLGKYNIWDEKDLTAGWDFDFTDSWDGSIAYAHQFYNSQTPKLNSVLDNSIIGETGYDFNIIYTSITAESDFGSIKSKAKKKNNSLSDFSLIYAISHLFEIDHLFRKKKKDELDIEPKISWEGGTQNSYDQYFKKKAENTQGYTYNPVKSPTAFSTLNYEFSLPITYTIGHFSIVPEWDYYLPQNVISADVSSKPYGIGILTLSYTFRKPK
ncbi:MAG: hypothetical protein ABI199_07915 [Bacteroidia bacterium]